MSRKSTVYMALALTLEMALPTAPQPAHVAVMHALPAQAANIPPQANMLALSLHAVACVRWCRGVERRAGPGSRGEGESRMALRRRGRRKKYNEHVFFFFFKVSAVGGGGRLRRNRGRRSRLK